VPEATQSLILTRLAGRTPMPAGEGLAELARPGASMAIYLSAGDPEGVRQALLDGGYPAIRRWLWPIAWAGRASSSSGPAWPTCPSGCARPGPTVRRFFGPARSYETGVSKLYDPAFAHGFRPAQPKDA